MGATTGCVPAPKGYFKAMKSVCDKHGVLLILDEVSFHYLFRGQFVKYVD